MPKPARRSRPACGSIRSRGRSTTSACVTRSRARSRSAWAELKEVSKTQPFQGESITALTLSIANEAPVPLPATVPVAFAEVVFRCLEKDPAKRFTDVGELAAALAPCTSAQTSALATSVANVLTASMASVDSIPTAPDLPSDKVTTLRGATGAVATTPISPVDAGVVEPASIDASVAEPTVVAAPPPPVKAIKPTKPLEKPGRSSKQVKPAKPPEDLGKSRY